jgi:hypothetical protein
MGELQGALCVGDRPRHLPGPRCLRTKLSMQVVVDITSPARHTWARCARQIRSIEHASARLLSAFVHQTGAYLWSRRSRLGPGERSRFVRIPALVQEVHDGRSRSFLVRCNDLFAHGDVSPEDSAFRSSPHSFFDPTLMNRYGWTTWTSWTYKDFCLAERTVCVDHTWSAPDRVRC